MLFQSARGVWKMVIISNATSKVGIVPTAAKFSRRKVHFGRKKVRSPQFERIFAKKLGVIIGDMFMLDLSVNRYFLPCFIFKNRRFVYQTMDLFFRKTTFVLEIRNRKIGRASCRERVCYPV